MFLLMKNHNQVLLKFEFRFYVYICIKCAVDQSQIKVLWITGTSTEYVLLFEMPLTFKKSVLI